MSELSVLPVVVATYLDAHRVRDTGRAVEAFTDDATVTDEGRTYRGTREILEWLDRSAGEYTYTIELIGVELLDDSHVVATNHLEGDFPGGTAELRFAFTLRDGRIGDLVIA